MRVQQRNRLLIGASVLVAIAVIVWLIFLLSQIVSQVAQPRDITQSQAFAEPVTLSSVSGTLEVTLTARQGAASLDTVAEPVTNALLFGYTIERGEASNGQQTGTNLYPAPTLNVNPGETLIVHLSNELRNLTIADFADPAFVPAGKGVPLTPPVLKSVDLNNHTHGLHVSPSGQSDNVLLSIPAGASNIYTYQVPANMPQGLYWYHSHRHQVTAAETYLGLSGMLQIGHADGGIPAVTDNNIPVRNMALQYNYVFGRGAGMSQLNNVNWPTLVSTLTPPTGSALAAGTYQPSLAPVNFNESPVGTRFMTNWYAGPLSVNNNRGQTQFIPSNLMSFASSPGQTSASVPANPSLPDRQRDVQYTVNGQFQPTLKSKPGQTEIWVLANISDFAYERVQLTETSTGTHPQIKVVAQDGNPYPNVHVPTGDNGTTLLIPPGSRFAIAVTMPQSGGLTLGLPPGPNSSASQPIAAGQSGPGVLYTHTGDAATSATLGTLSVPAESTSYFDGFFLFPTQKLLTVNVDSGDGAGTTVPFNDGQPLGAYTSFVNLKDTKPDVTRTFTVTGGFSNEHANPNDPQAFVYEFNNNIFPYTPIARPRLGSVEKWQIVNKNNDQHPIHIHVNDFQVTKIDAPNSKTITGAQMWGQDNMNLPAPLFDKAGNVSQAGVLELMTKFQDYAGTYVIHCHRLNHEDNGLMAIVNVIPAVSTYAVANPGSPGKDTTVGMYDGAGDKLLNTVTPFPGFTGAVTVAMGDVDGDQILDAIVGAGAGGSPDVVAYSGKAAAGSPAFTKQLSRFTALDPTFRGGVTVAAGNMDGASVGDNIIVGAGPGMESTVKVFRPDLGNSTSAPTVFSTFKPYGSSQTGVTLTTGSIDTSGRTSLITAPGPGDVAQIKTFSFSLFTKNSDEVNLHAGHTLPQLNATTGTSPDLTSAFSAFASDYSGGVSLSVGLMDASAGGAGQIVVGQLAGTGLVNVYSSGSALAGQPTMYLSSPTGGAHAAFSFSPIASFSPFGSGGAVHVATTSTTNSSDLLVSGVNTNGQPNVSKYSLTQTGPTSKTLTPKLITTLTTPPSGNPGPIAGF